MGGVSLDSRIDSIQLRHLAPELRKLLGASGGSIPSGGGGLGAPGWTLRAIKFVLSGDTTTHSVAAFCYQASGGTQYLAWGIEQPDGTPAGVILWQFQFSATAAALFFEGVNYRTLRSHPADASGHEVTEYWTGATWAIVTADTLLAETSLRTTDTATTHFLAADGSGSAAFRALANSDLPGGAVRILHAVTNTTDTATVSNTTTATALDSYTIPANTLANGDMLEGRIVWYVYDDDGALLAGDFNLVPSYDGSTLSTAISQTLTIGNPPPKNIIACFGVVDWTIAREGTNIRYSQKVKTNVNGGTGVDTPLDFVTTSGAIGTSFATGKTLAFKLAFTNASANIQAWVRTATVKLIRTIVS